MRKLILFAGCALSLAHAQGDFSTAGGDAHRSGWVRSDPKINRASMQKPSFDFLWKVKVASPSLTEAALMTHYIGYRGFRALGFIGGGADKVFAFDTDLGRVEWQKTLDAKPSTCGMTSNVARPVGAAFPGGGGGRGGGGRANYAKSAVGEPGQGAVTVKDAAARIAAAAAAPPRPPAPPGAPSIFAPHREYVYAIASDGMLHALNVSNGEEFDPPVPFLSANVNAAGLIVTGNAAYASIVPGCGSTESGVWAVDLATKQVASWKGSIVGAPAFGPDSTVYIATAAGELMALEAKTLKVKEVYKAEAGFATSPLVFQGNDGTMVALAAKDGRIHLVDTSKVGGPASQSEPVAQDATALAAWQDGSGIRYLLASTQTSLVALKMNGSTMETAWTRPMTSPLAPLVVNGVVFAAASSPAKLYALDGVTGAPLWDSGKTIAGSLRGGISAGTSQVYLGTQDGTFYAFGFPIEH